MSTRRASRSKPYWILDAETDPFEHGAEILPFIWGLYGGPSGEDYHEFDHTVDVVKFLESLEHVVYAHNGGKFDYHYLRPWINTGEPLSIINGRLARFRIGVCEFRDSMNILPVSLATFKKDDFDYSLMRRENRDLPANREKIQKYLRNDCRYLYELVSAHRKENGVQLTQAGASMRAWQRQSGVKAPRQTEVQYRRYKPHYYGGRVQCFKSGVEKTDFKVIDINSAYPYAMLSDHPFSTSADIDDRLPPEGKLHTCLITLTCTARGCFPYRQEHELFFPHDETTIRRYQITGYEFIAALKRDAIKNVTIEEVCHFSECINFSDFILSNWERRAQAKLDGNKALDIIVKLLMNSLYGKFASDYSKYREYQLSWTDDLARYLQEGWSVGAHWGEDRHLLERPTPQEKYRFYNIATAASITGYVRAMLFEALCDVRDPLYCDTDSIACADTGALPLGAGLGAWKVEGEFDEYAIAGKKLYAFHVSGRSPEETTGARGEYENYKVASKGVDFSPAEIKRAALGETVSFVPWVPTYSVKRETPMYIGRDVRRTAKDIRAVPATKPARLA